MSAVPTDVSKNLVEETIGVTGEPDLSNIVEGLRSLAVPISTLRHDPRNARKHGTANLAAIEDSLRKFGQQKPIVIDRDGKILAGNGTVEAAKSLGWLHVAAVRSALTGHEATGFALADNRTAELAEWDKVELARLVSEIPTNMLIGFDRKYLDQIMSVSASSVVEDDVPELTDAPFTRPGDLWSLGDHRLLCGSSSNPLDVDRLFGDRMADMVLTDPPYGVAYVGKTANALTIENDDIDEDSLAALVSSVFGIAEQKSRPGAYWYATVPARPLHLVFAEDWKKRGILRQIMVWSKDSMVLGHSEYHYQHEPILFGWKPGGERHRNPDRTRTTLWTFDRPKRSEQHPTMKPVALWARAIEDGSRRNELVFDPFLGSGTSVVACERMGRVCFGVEISPAYCDVIVRRWEAATGRKATRQDGDVFGSRD